MTTTYLTRGRDDKSLIEYRKDQELREIIRRKEKDRDEIVAAMLFRNSLAKQSMASGGGVGGGSSRSGSEGGGALMPEEQAALMKLNRELKELSERAGSNPAASPPNP